VAPGFGTRGTEGKILAAQYARVNKVPYFGICLGMQIAVIEFARHVAGMPGANSAEFDDNASQKVIDLMPDQRAIEDKGATMRLGAYPCVLKEGTLAAKAYGKLDISERHRHRYEVSDAYRETLEQRGLVVSGASPDGHLVEMIELANHPFFVGCQFHPEFKSRPQAPQPLFRDFVAAALKTRGGKAINGTAVVSESPSEERA